jgi:hypothetical protein
MPLRTDKLGLNVQVIKWNERADAHLWPADLNPTVYALADLWSTHDGNWNYQGDARWTPPQWARQYVEEPPWGQPGYFDDAGGDHHLFAAVRGLDGKLKKGWTMVFGKEGVSLPAMTSQSAWETHPTKDSGWANVPVWELYYPDQGQVGKWAVWPFGASDIVLGGGMPYNNHTSTFAVFQEVPRNVPLPDPDPNVPADLSPVTQRLDRLIALQEALNRHLGVPA